MARIKSENSDRTFGGLGLEPAQEKYLQKFLKQKGISLAAFQRSLIRGWLRTQKIGVSDLTENV